MFVAVGRKPCPNEPQRTGRLVVVAGGLERCRRRHGYLTDCRHSPRAPLLNARIWLRLLLGGAAYPPPPGCILCVRAISVCPSVQGFRRCGCRCVAIVALAGGVGRNGACFRVTHRASRRASTLAVAPCSGRLWLCVRRVVRPCCCSGPPQQPSGCDRFCGSAAVWSGAGVAGCVGRLGAHNGHLWLHPGAHNRCLERRLRLRMGATLGAFD